MGISKVRVIFELLEACPITSSDSRDPYVSRDIMFDTLYGGVAVRPACTRRCWISSGELCGRNAFNKQSNHHTAFCFNVLLS